MLRQPRPGLEPIQAKLPQPMKLKAPNRMLRIICTVGLSCVGKTTLSRRLSADLNCGFFSTGNFEREQAKLLGYSDVIEYEKKLGLQLAYVDLFPEMYRQIEALSVVNDLIVVEGVYSPQFYSWITSHFCSESVVVLNVTSPRNLRARRFAEREGVGIDVAKKKMRMLDRGKYEVGISEMQLMSRSSSFANRTTMEEVYRAIRQYIVAWLSRRSCR